jgi:hypothetical protein
MTDEETYAALKLMQKMYAELERQFLEFDEIVPYAHNSKIAINAARK